MNHVGRGIAAPSRLGPEVRRLDCTDSPLTPIDLKSKNRGYVSENRGAFGKPKRFVALVDGWYFAISSAAKKKPSRRGAAFSSFSRAAEIFGLPMESPASAEDDRPDPLPVRS